MSPVAVIAGTFVIWLAIRKRFDKYSALVNKKEAPNGVSPSVSDGGSGGGSKELSAATADLGAALKDAWKGLVT